MAQNNRKIIKDEVIKIWLPEVQQKTHFSCAAAVVHSICAYYGLGLDSHYDYFPYLETDESYGTLPEKILNYFQSVGLSCKLRHNMTIVEVCEQVERGRPVILAVQAYGNPKKYHKSGNGHYVVAIGFDAANIYFEDPMLNCIRGYMPKTELKKRWHDIDYKGVERQQLGIIVWNEKKPVYVHRAKRIP